MLKGFALSEKSPPAFRTITIEDQIRVGNVFRTVADHSKNTIPKGARLGAFALYDRKYEVDVTVATRESIEFVAWSAEVNQYMRIEDFNLLDTKLAKIPEVFFTFCGINRDGTRFRFKPHYALVLYDVGCASVLQHIQKKNVNGREIPEGWKTITAVNDPKAKVFVCDLRFYADKFNIPIENVWHMFKDFAEMGLLSVWLLGDTALVVLRFWAFGVLVGTDHLRSPRYHAQWRMVVANFAWERSDTNGGLMLG